MNERLYYWVEGLQGYTADGDNENIYNDSLEIRRLNFFIGKNNSGKSRFLRGIFLSKLDPSDYSYLNPQDFLGKLKQSVFETSGGISYKNSYASSTERRDLLRLIDEVLHTEPNKLRLNVIQEKRAKIKKIMEYRDELNRNKFRNITEQYDLESSELYRDLIFNNKFYIPILRGMRPLLSDEGKHPYVDRAIKDYFPEHHVHEISKKIITGESLYNELKIHLLGEPEQRELIKNYEKKLSQYFFDNEVISLIPKHDQDVVNIKIGVDSQFPISQLGDGLQQIIILTYEAFIRKGEKNTFFIEEPELHMHAGMVRQLMNFYLNETNHYYFFTTHSNHLLDMADESDQVMIQKFVKKQKILDRMEHEFKIYRCDRDRDLLASLGVKPSSVYLANCTIWVEGITDRLYITKYMEKYLNDLEKLNSTLYEKYRRFMPNYHYTFVEYAGSNLVHWCFSDSYADLLDDKGLSAKAVASEMLLIADGDIVNKSNRVKVLKSELRKENYCILECKETENTLPSDTIIRVAKHRFTKMHEKTKKGFSIDKLNEINDKEYFNHTDWGIGKLLDSKIRNARTSAKRTVFAEGTGVGTIKSKLDFCRETIKDFDENPGWELTPKAKSICERIFKHIEKCNL